jgi:hypothetical protein
MCNYAVWRARLVNLYNHFTLLSWIEHFKRRAVGCEDDSLIQDIQRQISSVYPDRADSLLNDILSASRRPAPMQSGRPKIEYYVQTYFDGTPFGVVIRYNNKNYLSRNSVVYEVSISNYVDTTNPDESTIKIRMTRKHREAGQTTKTFRTKRTYRPFGVKQAIAKKISRAYRQRKEQQKKREAAASLIQLRYREHYYRPLGPAYKECLKRFNERIISK